MIENQCKKQTTLAIIIKDKQVISIGTNSINTQIDICPRVKENMKTGEGYFLCKEVCKQNGHAEVEACKSAGENAIGADLHLIGHTYCCDNCLSTMKGFGIKRVFISDNTEPIIL